MKFLYALAIIIVIPIFWINISLYSFQNNYSEVHEDIIKQLNFLDQELKQKNLGLRMQQLFPEGFVFVNALYGLSWCELILADKSYDSLLKSRAIDEAIYAYNQLESEDATWSFDQNLKPENGIFYLGWKNYLLSKMLSVDTAFVGREIYLKKFRIQSDEIQAALLDSEIPFLESYNSQTWPADMFVTMASLSNYDKCVSVRYNTTIEDWIQEVKKNLDHKTKMIPHKVDSKSGDSIFGAQGCSMSLMLRMLAEIDSSFAQKQFKLFKEGFVDTRFGLPAVREFPKGTKGKAHIDSGPIIFGVGFSATISSISMFAEMNKPGHCNKQFQTIHAFGFSRTKDNQKKYLFGLLPMADAFIAWGRATNLKNIADISKEQSSFWRLKFHLISILIVFVVCLPIILKSKLH